MKFSFPKKEINKRALICALILTLVVLVVVGVRSWGVASSLINTTPNDLIPTFQSVYTLDHIPNISRVLSSVGKTVLHVNQAPPPVEMAILPHHADIGSTIDQYWAEIASNTKPEVIVIVSPAHFDQGNNPIQTTSGLWETPFGTVAADDQLIVQLRKEMAVSLEPASFQNEHGISVQTPYIAYYFPNIPIVPIIAQSKAGQTNARALIETLLGTKKQILLIASIDLSHYQSAGVSDRNDEETRRAIAFDDLDRIDQMGPDFLDSSFALDAYVYMRSFSGCRSQERWHDHNSRMFENIRPEQGTSYFVYTCSTRSVLRISAVGDIMLDRGVGAALERMDLPVTESLVQMEALLNSVTGDSDLTFANLESVLSNKGKPLSKAYVFEADPKHVELLKKWHIGVLSVSNNHTEDYGKQAWEQSVNLLRAEGMTAIGGYSNEANMETTIAGGKIIAFLGFQNLTVPFSFEKATAAIATAKQTHDLVIVSMHWGTEYIPTPDPQTIELAHALIDVGADIILGHHPHVLQPVEVYNGKLIFYSLGNFIFDQIGEEQNKSMIANIDVWDDGEMTYQTTPIQIERNFPRHVLKYEQN